MNTSQLGPDGFTFTLTKAHIWCEQQVKKIREAIEFNSGEIQGHIWAYRHDDCEMLALHVTVDGESIYDATITGNDGEYESILSGDEVYIPDMVEAIHLAGIIFMSLDIPLCIGRNVNELNEDVLYRPLKNNETNGPINLWKNN